jgi:hypothetical protein
MVKAPDIHREFIESEPNLMLAVDYYPYET